MSDIADQLVRLGEGIAFPARLRVFASAGAARRLPPGLEGEWTWATTADRFAAACGAAWAEARRGGRVALLPGVPADDPAGDGARALAGRLGLGNLHHLALGDPRADDGEDEWPVLRREWQPVRLSSLPMGGLPPWPADGDGRAMEAWLAEREPRLFLAHARPGWAQAEPGPALCVALGQLAAEGLRVLWRVPAGAPLGGWGAALAELGRRGLGLKLLVAGPLPPTLVARLDGWWVWSPADAGELAAVLANVLDHEEPSLVVLPSPAAGIPPWPAQHAAVAGDGRELLAGGGLTVVADGWRAGRALALAGALRDAGAFACTSVRPLPVAQLAALAARGPLAVLDEELAAAIASAIASVGGARVLALPGGDQDLESLLARVRAAR